MFTDYDLEIARDVLQAYLEKLERDEPYAFNTIAALEETLASFPSSLDEVND